jgi:hypothetical protein
MGSVEVETANNDCLIRMIGEDVQLECPSTAQIARVGDLLRSKVVRCQDAFKSSLLLLCCHLQSFNLHIVS